MKRDLTLWAIAALAAIIVSMSAYMFKQVTNDVEQLGERMTQEVKELRSTVQALTDALTETNSKLKANAIDWPQPVRRASDADEVDAP